VPPPIQINHPEPNGTSSSSFFVAFGETWKERNIIGLLLGGPRPLVGITLKAGPHWAVRFDHVPHGDYDLLVFDPLKPLTLATRHFKVRHTFAAVITYPGGNSTVCTSFTAYGTVNAGETSVSGVMVDNRGMQIQGLTIQQPTLTNPGWAIQWHILGTLNNPYTLKVTAMTGIGPPPAPTQSGNITVQTC
jgi:hypothetical protein